MSIFKYFITILIVSTNYTFVHLLDNKVFLSEVGIYFVVNRVALRTADEYIVDLCLCYEYTDGSI